MKGHKRQETRTPVSKMPHISRGSCSRASQRTAAPRDCRLPLCAEQRSVFFIQKAAAAPSLRTRSLLAAMCGREMPPPSARRNAAGDQNAGARPLGAEQNHDAANGKTAEVVAVITEDTGKTSARYGLPHYQDLPDKQIITNPSLALKSQGQTKLSYSVLRDTVK